MLMDGDVDVNVVNVEGKKNFSKGNDFVRFANSRFGKPKLTQF